MQFEYFINNQNTKSIKFPVEVSRPMPPKSKQKSTKCQVCFYNTSSTSKINELICCKQCKKLAHRYCYLPQCQGKQFLCDVCENQAKSPVCCVCKGDGLLKRTRQGDYGHPLCLLFCRDSLVISYKTLTFHFLRSKRKYKQQKCHICSISSPSFDVVQCFAHRCPEKAHLYCILKQQHKNTEEESKWVHELRVFQNAHVNFLQLFKIKVERCIKFQSYIVHKEIFGGKKIVEENGVNIAYCRKHYENLSNCTCQELEDNEEVKVDWVFCDSCCKWYHFHCQQITETELPDKYTCKQCLNWHKIIAQNKEPILKVYPRLYLYDTILIQLYAESRNYMISPETREILERIPLLCSIKYFTQVVKNKDMVTKVIRSINFINIKKIIIDRKQKQLGKVLEKLDKGFIGALWKIDFLTKNDPIEAILNGFKNGKYQPEQILQIFQKYQKKYVQGLNIIKPSIKQLQKLQSIKKQQEQQQNQQTQQYQQIKQTLKTILLELQQTPHSYSKILTQLYIKVDCNQLFKEIVRDYVDLNLEDRDIYTPIFIYEHLEDMVQHNQIIACSKLVMKNLAFKKNLLINIQKFNQKYQKCSKKVKTTNSNIARQLQILKSCQPQKENNYNWSNLPILQRCSSHRPTQIDSVHCVSFFQQNSAINLSKFQKQLTVSFVNQYVRSVFKSAKLTRNGLQQLTVWFLGFRKGEVFGNFKENLMEIYLKLYDSASKLVSSICEVTPQESQLLDIDFMKYIKQVQIDRVHLFRFCSFFLEVAKLKLQDFDDSFEKIIKQKSEEFLNYISSRSMIFQCQVEFKTAKLLIKKYNFSFSKIKELIQKNTQLQQIIHKISLKNLQNPQFLLSCSKTLKQGKEYCQDNNLQFRINKIDYLLRLFECKIEAFQYFPNTFITKHPQSSPTPTSPPAPIESVDFYLLKKYLYKLKMLKYPKQDYLYIQLQSHYLQKLEYFNLISYFLNNYNCLLSNLPTTTFEPKLTKEQMLALIESKKEDRVTCIPEELEIGIICQIYGEILKKMERIVARNCLQENVGEVRLLQQKLLKIPLDSSSNAIYVKFCKFLKEIEEKRQNFHDPEQQFLQNKKVQLDETSAKAECSNKSSKMLGNLSAQVRNKPRTLTLEQIQARIKQTGENLADGQSNIKLKEMMSQCRKIMKDNNSLISKFLKTQPYTEPEVRAVKNMLNVYESQPIRMQIIETISTQLKTFENAITEGHYMDKNVMKSLNPSFFEVYAQSSSSIKSTESQRNEPRAMSQNKKTKLVLRK